MAGGEWRSNKRGRRGSSVPGGGRTGGGGRGGRGTKQRGYVLSSSV